MNVNDRPPGSVSRITRADKAPCMDCGEMTHRGTLTFGIKTIAIETRCPACSVKTHEANRIDHQAIANGKKL